MSTLVTNPVWLLHPSSSAVLVFITNALNPSQMYESRSPNRRLLIRVVHSHPTDEQLSNNLLSMKSERSTVSRVVIAHFSSSHVVFSGSLWLPSALYYRNHNWVITVWRMGTRWAIVNILQWSPWWNVRLRRKRVAYIWALNAGDVHVNYLSLVGGITKSDRFKIRRALRELST